MEPKMAIIQNKMGKRITIIIETFFYMFFTIIDSKEYRKTWWFACVKWELSIVIHKFLSIYGLTNEENVAISNLKNPKK